MSYDDFEKNQSESFRNRPVHSLPQSHDLIIDVDFDDEPHRNFTWGPFRLLRNFLKR